MTLGQGHFLTFGAGERRYVAAARRIRGEAGRSGLFQSLQIADQDWVNDPKICPEAVAILAKNCAQGFGLWAWKPHAIAHILRKLPENAWLLYADGGCEFNPWLRGDDAVWSSLVDSIPLDSPLAFFHAGRVAQYTKLETLDYFDPERRTLEFPMAQANILLFRANDATIEFVSEWAELCIVDGSRLLRDPLQVENEAQGFIAHRHDQSILTQLLYERTVGPSLVPSEFGSGFFEWRRAGRHFPIWSSHNRRGMPLYSARGLHLPLAYLRHTRLRWKSSRHEK